MKKILLFSLTTIFLVACKPDKGYIIKGNIKDASFNNKMVYLQSVDSVINIDSATITNGSFELKGVTDSIVVRYLAIGKNIEKNDQLVPVLLEPGSKLEISLDSIITVKGNPANEAYTLVRTKEYGLREKMRTIMKQYQEAKTNNQLNDSLELALSDQYDVVSKEYADLMYGFAQKNMNNKLGEYIFTNYYSEFDAKQQRELINLGSDSFKKQPFTQKINERLINMEKVAVGNKFTDFTLKTPDGKDVKLSDYAGKGKYVLIDFWASWCGPCRNELPKVVELYKKYKNKGFEIVGVSLDKEHADWVKGIKDLGLTWPQMSDVKAWESIVVSMYGIQAIPHTVLLDKNGTIIANELHGNKLEQKLSELMP